MKEVRALCSKCGRTESFSIPDDFDLKGGIPLIHCKRCSKPGDPMSTNPQPEAPLTDEQIIDLKNQAYISLHGQNLPRDKRRACRVILRLGRELQEARQRIATLSAGEWRPTDGFTVIDKETGERPNLEQIALKEEWAKGLIYCDMEGFALQDDGTLVLQDECGSFRYCPADRFEIRPGYTEPEHKWEPTHRRKSDGLEVRFWVEAETLVAFHLKDAPSETMSSAEFYAEFEPLLIEVGEEVKDS